MKIKTLFSAAILHTACLFPATYTWVPTGSGNWSLAGNWSPAGGPPTLAGDVATFSTSITAASVVTVDLSSFIVGSLAFTNTNNAYTIAASGTNSLALQGSSGTVTITNAAGVTSNNIISTPMVLTNPLTITQNSGTNGLSISGVMSGPSSVTTAGAGITIFTGANTYAGGTTVTAGELDVNATGTLPAAGTLTITGGTVKCGALNALPASGAVTLSGGTLNLNNSNQSTGPISGTSNITLGTATLTSTTTTSTSYTGVISGTGGFALAGSGGTLTFGTNQVYSGGTTVNGSTLTLNPGINLFSGGNLTVSGTGVFNLNNNSQTIGALAGTGNGSIVLGTGALTTNTAAPSTFSGVISGTGTFTHAGTANLTFTGQNSYTGGTTINAGATLVLGGNNALAPTGPVSIVALGILDMTPAASTLQTIGPLSGSGNVNLGATKLTINSSSSSSYGGVMNGTGSLIVAGPQVFTLTNNNTFTGGTTVTGGTLRLIPASLSNALAPAGSLTINTPGIAILNNNTTQTIAGLSGNGTFQLSTASTLTVNPTTSSTFSGAITGLGALVVGGPAPQILTGANSYSGGTTVNASGILQGTTTGLQGLINNSGSVIFDQTFSGTFTGSLTGAGSLSKSGSGNVIFNTSQVASSTNITAGQLTLQSPATFTSNVTIGPSGTLSGNGIVNGLVNNNGTMSVGTQTFNIVGDYQQNAGSFFNVGITPSSSGLLNVANMVLITSPATIDIDVTPGIYSASSLYTVITASSPVVGTFSAPVFDNPFFTGSLLYNQAPMGGSVQLQLEFVPFSNVIKGGNAGAIAKCINPQLIPGSSDLSSIIANLVFLPVHDVKKALNEIQPSQLKSLALIEENNLVVVRSSLSQHTQDFYKTDCNKEIAELYRWNVWGNLNGDFLRQDGSGQNIGYSAQTFGGTAGIDYAFARNMFLGLAGAYGKSWFDWNKSRGHGNIRSYYLGPYFTWCNHRFFTNLSILATRNNYFASRHISFSHINAHARSHHMGYGLLGHFDLGVLLYPAPKTTLSPLAGFDLIHLHEQGYKEKDAKGLNMRISPTHHSLLRSELGFEIAKCATLTRHKWTHDLKLSWIHQFVLSGKNLQAQFPEVKCSYTVQGRQPTQDYLDVATGITALLKDDKLSLALRYEGKFGDGIHDNTGYIRAVFRF